MKQSAYPVENGGGVQRRSQLLFRTTSWILIVVCTSVLSFYIGVWTGIHASGNKSEMGEVKVNASCPSDKEFRELEA